MVRAGEASGTLPLVLTQLADFGEREQGLQSRIRAALLYPLFLALSGAAMLVLLLTVVLPRRSPVRARPVGLQPGRSGLGSHWPRRGDRRAHLRGREDHFHRRSPSRRLLQRRELRGQ